MGRTPWNRTPISACPRTIRGCISYNGSVNSAALIGGDVTLAGNTTTFCAGNPLSLQSNLYLNGAGAVVSGSAITLAAGKTIQGQGAIQTAASTRAL